MASILTRPASNKYMLYSRRGESSGGAALGAVTGKTVIAESVRPRSGILSQRADGLSTFRLKCSASIETQPPDSTKPFPKGDDGIRGSEFVGSAIAPPELPLLGTAVSTMRGMELDSG